MIDEPKLRDLLEAFNAHDLDRSMAFFAEDRVLETPRGSDLLDVDADGRITRKDSHWKIATEPSLDRGHDLGATTARCALRCGTEMGAGRRVGHPNVALPSRRAG